MPMHAGHYPGGPEKSTRHACWLAVAPCQRRAGAQLAGRHVARCVFTPPWLLSLLAPAGPIACRPCRRSAARAHRQLSFPAVGPRLRLRSQRPATPHALPLGCSWPPCMEINPLSLASFWSASYHQGMQADGSIQLYLLFRSTSFRIPAVSL